MCGFNEDFTPHTLRHSFATLLLEKSINIRFEDRNATRDAQHAVLDEEAHWVRERDPISGDIVDRLAIPIGDAMDIVAGQGGGS